MEDGRYKGRPGREAAVAWAAGIVLATVTALAQAVPADDPFGALLRQRNWAAVESLARARLAADPNDRYALLAMGRLPIAQEDETRLESSISSLRACVAVAPDFADCHVWLGTALGIKAHRGGVLATLGLAGQVRGEFEEAVRLAPANFSARFSLQQFYLQAPAMLGGGAQKAREQSTEMGKSNALYGKMLQVAQDLNDNQTPAAESLLFSLPPPADEDVLETFRSLYVNVGNSYFRASKPKDAQRVFEAMTRRFAQDVQGWLGLGRAIQEQGRQDEALALFQKACDIRLDPVALLRMGQIYAARGNRDKAIDLLQRAVDFKPALSHRQLSDANDLLRKLKG